MKGLMAAVAFLTILPVRSSRAQMASARAWFPAVGILVGASAAAVDLLIGWMATGALFGPDHPSVTLRILAGTVTVGVLAVVTGALHLDGFIDTCDALWGGSDVEHRRRILQDPHAGAFAVVGVTCLLLVKVAAISALPWDRRGWVLIVIPCLSRATMLLTTESFPYVGKGLGSEFLSRKGRGQLGFGLAFALAAGLALVGPLSLALMTMASLIGWLIGAFATRLLGGMTGDVYGAVAETTEVAGLVAAALFAARWPALWGW